MERVIESVDYVVMEEMKQSLVRPYTEEEVRTALFQMQPFKSPGPDDNTTVAFEMLHRMKNRRKGTISHMVVKLDISKAYDRVEWEFLR
ncbi:hypothetical protein SO802_015813 [Lithocarpus litseifolius]|uniref:Reverse transcriptase domain-containing protein n=1 Tax=Lithocarpus litseifolius TaxID=425828 RepID=A0AAW2CUR2_9ROSI